MQDTNIYTFFWYIGYQDIKLKTAVALGKEDLNGDLVSRVTICSIPYYSKKKKKVALWWKIDIRKGMFIYSKTKNLSGSSWAVDPSFFFSVEATLSYDFFFRFSFFSFPFS